MTRLDADVLVHWDSGQRSVKLEVALILLLVDLLAVLLDEECDVLHRIDELYRD